MDLASQYIKKLGDSAFNEILSHPYAYQALITKKASKNEIYLFALYRALTEDLDKRLYKNGVMEYPRITSEELALCLIAFDFGEDANDLSEKIENIEIKLAEVQNRMDSISKVIN